MEITVPLSQRPAPKRCIVHCGNVSGGEIAKFNQNYCRGSAGTDLRLALRSTQLRSTPHERPRYRSSHEKSKTGRQEISVQLQLFDLQERRAQNQPGKNLQGSRQIV